MIPKIIHFCWLSNDPFPKKIARCIKSWEKHLVGYELKLWDYNSFPRGKSKWVDQAFDNKKYAFAADYIRAFALYTEGGIYLDTDVELLKNFDNFLHLPYFLGQENDSGLVEAAVMGSEKGNPVFKELLDYYDIHDFKRADGSLDTQTLPTRLYKILSNKGKLCIIHSIAGFDNLSNEIYLFTPEYFSPIHLINMKIEKSDNTVAIHHFAGTWKSPWHQYKKKIQQLIGPAFTTCIQRIKHLIVKH